MLLAWLCGARGGKQAAPCTPAAGLALPYCTPLSHVHAVHAVVPAVPQAAVGIHNAGMWRVHMLVRPHTMPTALGRRSAWQVVGAPSEDDMAFVTSDKARKYLCSMPKYPAQDLAALWPHAAPATIDLITRMLQFNPARRITVQQALQHPYFTGLHDPSDEPVAAAPFDTSYNSDTLSCEAIRQLLLQEVLSCHPELAHEDGYAALAAQPTSEA